MAYGVSVCRVDRLQPVKLQRIHPDCYVLAIANFGLGWVTPRATEQRANKISSSQHAKRLLSVERHFRCGRLRSVSNSAARVNKHVLSNDDDRRRQTSATSCVL